MLYIQTYLALVLFIKRSCIVSTASWKTEVVKEINKQLAKFKLSMDLEVKYLHAKNGSNNDEFNEELQTKFNQYFKDGA